MSIGTEWAVPWMTKLIHITTVKTLKIIQRYHCSTNAIVINAREFDTCKIQFLMQKVL